MRCLLHKMIIDFYWDRVSVVEAVNASIFDVLAIPVGIFDNKKMVAKLIERPDDTSTIGKLPGGAIIPKGS